MLKLILILLFIAIIAFAIYASMQPDEFRITRSTRMHVPPQVPFDLVNDFHKWANWSPWAKLDLSAKNIFEGPPVGTGSTFRWDGNRHVGAGVMTIEESHPSDLIKIRLEFFKPMKAVNTSEFTFKPEGDQTLVTWSMYGKNNFIGKVMNIIMNCDKMVGGMFEKGLASMKAIAENKGASV